MRTYATYRELPDDIHPLLLTADDLAHALRCTSAIVLGSCGGSLAQMSTR
ncbi:hypothetical protein [Rhodococcus sp. (in: high G+C Gram-positive bacteria)]|nr:hypothetical protein [Rhodococcus sp. (in: high G+C Gram-positive bacteria)]MBQ9055504.1 hypothetical protein [Rhodococcus sp. (in: high G+C Gram-positive bacteria)]